MNRGEKILQQPSSPFEHLQRQYLQSMILRNCSERTIEYWAMNLSHFNVWCQERGIEEVTEVTIDTLNGYRSYLFHRRNPRTNKPLRFSTQHCYLIVVRRWMTWLYKQGHLAEDVGKPFELPRPEQRLPLEVLTADEVESILNQTDVTRPVGLRDRAMLEVFYSTGIRNSELVSLQLYDVDEARGVLVIRQGKGKKDRVVPLGDRALQWIKKYVADVRPSLVALGTSGTILFLNSKGRPFVRGHLSMLVRGYKRKAGITKVGSCHLLRHTAATLMMDNGADLRSLQEFLGHARLTTTQIYTHVSITRLQEVHKRTHPASRAPATGVPAPGDPACGDGGQEVKESPAPKDSDDGVTDR
jgi:integrase/recombinase XerD